MRQCLLVYLLLILLAPTAAASLVGCPKKCGNITFDYPTTRLAWFAEGQRPSAKAQKPSAKALLRAALGKEPSGNF
jgi:hypothetical protein